MERLTYLSLKIKVLCMKAHTTIFFLNPRNLICYVLDLMFFPFFWYPEQRSWGKASWWLQLLTGSGGQRWALLSVTATGPKGAACSCARGGLGVRERLCPRGRWAWNILPRAAGMALSCQRSQNIWTTLSDVGFGFWMDLHGARSWTWWSWTVGWRWDVTRASVESCT